MRVNYIDQKKNLVALCYLIRGKDAGLKKAYDFIEAYDRHPCKISHGIYFLLKGFDDIDDSVIKNLITKISKPNSKIIYLPDDGYDIGAYFHASKIVNEEYICFLNTHSKPIHEGWLDLLYSATKLNDFGAAGCTGSWEGKIRKLTIKRFFFHPRSSVLMLLTNIFRIIRFQTYPNPHLRTNGFLISKKIFSDFIRISKFPRNKWDAYVLEHGRRGLSNFILKVCNKNLYVINSDGVTFPPSRWNISQTFWHGDQKKLLVSDNRTDQYLELQKNNPTAAKSMHTECWDAHNTEYVNS
jgi:hypothetical protein